MSFNTTAVLLRVLLLYSLHSARPIAAFILGIHLATPKTFPDDRRFELLKQTYHLDADDTSDGDNPDKESVLNEMDPAYNRSTRSILSVHSRPPTKLRSGTIDLDNTNDRNEIQS